VPDFWAMRRNQTRLPQLSHIPTRHKGNTKMNGIIYLVGLVVIVLAILSWIGLA
jgi:hypothetical protein